MIRKDPVIQDMLHGLDEISEQRHSIPRVTGWLEKHLREHFGKVGWPKSCKVEKESSPGWKSGSSQLVELPAGEGGSIRIEISASVWVGFPSYAHQNCSILSIEYTNGEHGKYDLTSEICLGSLHHEEVAFIYDLLPSVLTALDQALPDAKLRKKWNLLESRVKLRSSVTS